MGARLKRILVIGALVALASYPASTKADDVGGIAAGPTYSWSGFYIGGHVGAGALMTHSKSDIVGLVEYDVEGGGDGWLGGAMAGYNWQVSERVVLGLQGDIAFTDMESLSITTLDAGPDFVASASLRAGYLVLPETLFYVIGGYSYGEFDGNIEFPPDEFDNEPFDGFHIGAGMETRLTDRLTARIEYRYTEFGGEEPVDTLPGFEVDFTPGMHTGTLGLAFNLFPTAGEGEAVAPAADIVEPAVSWTGFYLGVNGGAGAFVDNRFGDGEISAGGDGFLGSLMAGFNWQAGERFVLGIEGAIGLADMDWDYEAEFNIVNAAQETSVALDWFASASARAGWLTSPETMIYVIGGYSYAEFDFDSKVEVPAQSVSEGFKESVDGFHVGAGIEAMLTDNLTARIEYRYTKYGKHEVESQLSPEFEFDPASHTGMVGIAWLFNEI